MSDRSHSRSPRTNTRSRSRQRSYTRSSSRSRSPRRRRSPRRKQRQRSSSRGDRRGGARGRQPRGGRGIVTTITDDGGRKVYIGNLSSRCQERDLEELFSKFGHIEDVYIPRDKSTWLGRGFAFVTFENHDSALEGAEEWDNRRFMGRKIAVNLARPRPAARGNSPTTIRKYVPSRDDF